MAVLPVESYSKSGKKAKSRYKYAVRSLKRRKDHIVSKKISSALTSKNNRAFWREVKRFKRSKAAKRSQSSVIDGFTHSHDITNNLGIDSVMFSTLLKKVRQHSRYKLYCQHIN